MKTEKRPHNYDICIYGSDLQAMHTAEEKSRAGLHTVLVYQGQSGREDFAPHGKLILQALRSSAATAHTYRTAEKFGILNAAPELGWHSIKVHIKDILERIAPHYSFEKLRAIGVEILQGPVQDEAVSAKEALHLETPEHIYEFMGMTTLSLENILGWECQPEHLLIIGAGASALELAQSLNRLGTKTTILSAGAALPGADSELFKILYDRLEYEGVRIIQNAEITAAEQSENSATVHMMHEGTKRRVSGTHLIAMPEEAPRAALCDPALGWAGINENEAREKFGSGNFHLVKWRYQESDYAQTQRKEVGLLKIITKMDGTVIGAGVCGAGAEEIIPLWSLALAQNMKLQDMTEIDIPYGSYAHISTRAAQGYCAQIKSPAKQYKAGSFWQGLIGGG